MLCDQRAHIPELVEPESFITMYTQHATYTCMNRARDVAQAYKKKKPGRLTDWLIDLNSWDVMTLLGAIYEAGRLQGIREERRKKRA